MRSAPKKPPFLRLLLLVAGLVLAAFAPAAQSGSVDVAVIQSSDDAEEAAGGSMDLSSSDLELVQEVSTQTVGVRFQGITIPPGATITDAYVQFTADNVGASIDPTDLTIRGELTPNALTFTSTAGNITGRGTTTALVNWSVDTWVTNGDALLAERTPNLKTVIQEIVDQGGWADGNALVIIITGTGKREAESFNGTAAP